MKSFPVRAVLYREDGSWVAHCLEVDLCGNGNTPEESLQSLSVAMVIQIEHSIKENNPANLFCPADGTRNCAGAIKRLQQKSGQYKDYGSVEGQFMTLNSPQGEQVVVDDSLTGESITCYFSTPEVETKARQCWDHRVCVIGEIRLDKLTGRPTSVYVEDVQRLRDQADIPQWDKVDGIDITGGMESSEYVRKLRDDAYG